MFRVRLPRTGNLSLLLPVRDVTRLFTISNEMSDFNWDLLLLFVVCESVSVRISLCNVWYVKNPLPARLSTVKNGNVKRARAETDIYGDLTDFDGNHRNVAKTDFVDFKKLNKHKPLIMHLIQEAMNYNSRLAEQ